MIKILDFKIKTNPYILQLHVPNPNMVLTTVYQFQNFPNLTVIRCRYIIGMQPK